MSRLFKLSLSVKPLNLHMGTCTIYTIIYVCMCLCVQAKKVCRIWGDPHYITFDGPEHAYQGTATYIMCQRKAASCQTLQDFRVVGFHQRFSTNPAVSFLMWMELYVFLPPGGTTRVKIGQSLQIWVSVQLFFSCCFVNCRYHCK